MTKKHRSTQNSSVITLNKKATHDYSVEQRLEAGIVLQGWEVKSIREGRIQLRDSHVVIKKGEAWLLGSQISPLLSASTHIVPDITRTRKLLLKKEELKKLIGNIERKGYTVIALKAYWKKGHVKIEIALAKGKKTHDKRESIKQRDWDREKARTLKNI